MGETEISTFSFSADFFFKDPPNDYITCKFYPKYKKIIFPLGCSPLSKPAFCRIKRTLVYEEPLEAS